MFLKHDLLFSCVHHMYAFGIFFKHLFSACECNGFLMMSIKFENEIVDLLLCPTAQDNFRYIRLRELLYNVRYEVHYDQIQDTLQILMLACSELEKFKEWKTRPLESKKCVSLKMIVLCALVLYLAAVSILFRIANPIPK